MGIYITLEGPLQRRAPIKIHFSVMINSLIKSAPDVRRPSLGRLSHHVILNNRLMRTRIVQNITVRSSVTNQLTPPTLNII